MAVHSLKMTQKIPASLPVVWELFSNPANLLKLTPPSFGLKILSADHEQSIYVGQLINYKVRPLFGITVRWMTEITRVEQDHSFVDEQRKGPYRLWKHEHRFNEIEGGVEMNDHVQYETPMGIIGKWANTLLVMKKLEQLFRHRYLMVEELLGKWEGQEFGLWFN